MRYKILVKKKAIYNLKIPQIQDYKYHLNNLENLKILFEKKG